MVTCPPQLAWAQAWSKAEHFRLGLGLLATSGEELPQLPRLQTAVFRPLFFVGDSLRG